MLERIGLRIKILHLLADLHPDLNRPHPSRFVQYPINGRAHAVQIEGRCAVE